MADGERATDEVGAGPHASESPVGRSRASERPGWVYVVVRRRTFAS